MGHGSGRGSGGGQTKLAKRNASTSRGAAHPPASSTAHDSDSAGREDLQDLRARAIFEPLKEALRALPDDADAAAAGAAQPGLPPCSRSPALVEHTFHGTAGWIYEGLACSMEDEFRRNEGGRWWTEYEYVVFDAAVELEHAHPHQPSYVMVRDRGRTGWRLADFARTAPSLSEAEVAAVRLYSGISGIFAEINGALRAQDVRPWATTISLLTSAIVKLAAETPLKINSVPLTLYRALPGQFLEFPSLHKSTGGAAESYTEPGFMSVTTDPKVAAAYCGAKHQEGFIWCMQPSFSSRPADISNLSLYPEQSELIFPPLTTLQIEVVERMQAIPKFLILARPHICTMRHYTDLLRYPWSSPQDPLTHDEYDMVWAADRKHQEQEAERASPDGKFSSNVKTLITGDPKAAALGLQIYMNFDPDATLAKFYGAPNPKVAAITAEFAAFRDKDKELEDGKTLSWWFDYVMHQPASAETMHWGKRDSGRNGTRLKDYLSTKEATKAQLSLEHVLALRLYTCTPVSFELNAPLRTFKLDDKTGNVLKPVSMREAHPFPVTVTVLNEAIQRLRDPESGALKTLWRGLKNLDVAENADFLVLGGVEMALMSASYDLETALFYSCSEHSVLIKYVTRSFMERGADVAWISAFPGENECLFPPTTYLSPTGRTQRVGRFTVVEVAPRL
jgi:hypothetical protein